jgi:hypothetical protein
MKKYILFIAIALYFASCKDEEVKIISIEQATETESGITIKWTKPEISGFKFYQIMRSNNGTNYSVINSISDISSDAYNQEITSFTDYSYPIADSIYYKILAIGDECISSEKITVKTKMPFFVLSQIYSLTAIPGSNNVAFTYYNNSYKLAIANLSTKKIINQLSLSYISSYDYLSSGIYNNQPEIYFYNSNDDKMNIYNANSFNSILSSGYYYLSNPKTVKDKNGNLYCISKSNSYIYSFNRQGTINSNYTSQTIYDIKYDSISNTIKVLGSTAVQTYNLSSDGIITSAGSKTITSYTYYSFIDGTNLLYRSGSAYTNIYDYSTGLSYNLNNTIAFGTIYYKSGNFYCIPYESSNKIYCYDSNSLVNKKIITCRASITSSCIDDNYLYITGYFNNNYSSCYIIDRKELIK